MELEINIPNEIIQTHKDTYAGSLPSVDAIFASLDIRDWRTRGSKRKTVRGLGRGVFKIEE